MGGQAQLLNARSVRWLDIAVAAWIVLWVVLGILIWSDIRAQTQLSTDVIKVGTAVKDTGQALGVVGAVPFVGGRISEFADRIETMGAEVERSGLDSRSGITRIALIAGFAVAVLPAAMVLFLYVPVRVRWRRNVGAIAGALRASAGDPALEQYLARRAVDALSWDELRGVSSDPWGDIGAGDCRALADAELRRLGIARP